MKYFFLFNFISLSLVFAWWFTEEASEGQQEYVIDKAKDVGGELSEKGKEVGAVILDKGKELGEKALDKGKEIYDDRDEIIDGAKRWAKDVQEKVSDMVEDGEAKP